VNILFLCTGNIHRSALAEALLRAEILRDGRLDLEVFSAGVLDMSGMPAVDEAILLAREAGADLSVHRSRFATPTVLSAADMVVVMERSHQEWLAQRCPEAVDRSRLLSDYAGPESGVAPGEDVPDALGEDLDSYRRTFGIIRACIKRLYRELPPPPEEIYTSAVEDRFRLRRGTPLTLSPADYDLVDRWWRRGVPLWIILESIDTLLGRKGGAGHVGRVRRLSYCEEEVERRFRLFESGRVALAHGAPPQSPQPCGDDILKIAARRLEAAARSAREKRSPRAARILEHVAGDLAQDAAGSQNDPRAARLRLHSLQESLVEELRGTTPADELDALREEAESSLADYRDRMTPSAFDATVTRLVARRLLDIHEVPDLSDL
jgi:protein-tyrosine phosphatase